MRFKAKIDANQKELVLAFANLGCSVLSLAQLGKGAPDLLVGFRGRSHAVEVKGLKGKLTPDQEAFRASWRGDYSVVRSTDDVLALITDWIAKVE